MARVKVPRAQLPDHLDLAGQAALETASIVAAIAVFVAALLLSFVILPVAALLLEVLLFGVLLGAGLFGVVVLRRPWTVTVRDDRDRFKYLVSGWRDSRAAMREIAEAIERGEVPPRPSGQEPVRIG